MSANALGMILVGLWALGCGPAAPPGESGRPASAVEERLAAKREELAEGGPSRTGRVPKSRSSPPVRPEVPRPSRTEQPAKVVEVVEGPGPSADRLPAHLSRRERLTRACYRDTFGVADPAHLRILLPAEREFCRCMVDTVISTGVSASLQDALIEDFKANRERVEAANPEFNRRWHRCRM